MNEALNAEKVLPAESPFGDGSAAQRTVAVIKESFV